MRISIFKKHRSLVSLLCELQVPENSINQEVRLFPCELKEENWASNAFYYYYFFFPLSSVVPQGSVPVCQPVECRCTGSRRVSAPKPGCREADGEVSDLPAPPGGTRGAVPGAAATCGAARGGADRGAPGRVPAVAAAARPALRGPWERARVPEAAGRAGTGPWPGVSLSPTPSSPRHRFPWGCKCRRGSWGAGGGCCCRRPAQRRSEGRSWWRQEQPRRRDEVSGARGRWVRARDGSGSGAGAGSAAAGTNPPALGAHRERRTGLSPRGLTGGERCAALGLALGCRNLEHPAGRGAQRADGDTEPRALQAERGRPCQM